MILNNNHPSDEAWRMLKKRELQDVQILYNLMIHPDIFPFVRHKANSYYEFLLITKELIQSELREDSILRTIVDEWGVPIGSINLFDILDNAGFWDTWLGKPYHGKGYNQLAKEAFLMSFSSNAALKLSF